ADAVPMGRVPGEPGPAGVRSEPVATGPAHGGRMGMDALPAPVFPDACVGLQREFGGLVAESLEQAEKALLARPRQPPIEKHRHGREDDAAVSVVVDLVARRLAETDRAL